MEQSPPNRKNPRLKEFDYGTNGYYFVTICSQNKEHIFGRIVGAAYTPPTNQEMPQFIPTPLGKIAEQNLVAIPKHFNNCAIETYVIMPNHVHFIISIGCHAQTSAGGEYAAPTKQNVTLPKIINAYKASVTRNFGEPVWQRSYYDHIIRGREDYKEIFQYISNNPLAWLLKNKSENSNKILCKAFL